MSILNRTIVAFMLILGTSCQEFFTDVVHAGKADRAVWAYDFEEVDNETLVAGLIGKNISRVFLSIDSRQLEPQGEFADATYTAKVRAFLVKSHAKGIEVHAMILQDGHFAFESSHARATGPSSVDFGFHQPS